MRTLRDEAREPGQEAAHRFLGALGDDRRHRFDASRVVVVVAHPDDETIGIGGQLARLSGVTLVHVTDGAPRDMADAHAHGFASREDYAAARRLELTAAAAEAGLAAASALSLDCADQEAAHHLCEITRRLAALFRERRFTVILTHAYEGGHPDHDATAFAVHAAAQLDDVRSRPGIVEMPFYRAGADGWVRQQFARDPASPEVALRLDAEALHVKRRMLAAHRTQERTLRSFDPVIERFRNAPAYDFTRLPNGGDLLYERYGWGPTGDEWRRLAADALRDLGLPPCP